MSSLCKGGGLRSSLSEFSMMIHRFKFYEKFGPSYPVQSIRSWKVRICQLAYLPKRLNRSYLYAISLVQAQKPQSCIYLGLCNVDRLLYSDMAEREVLRLIILD